MSNALPQDPLKRFVFFRNNRWEFLKHCVFTKDEVDMDVPIKRYPSHFEYCRFIVLMWEKHRRIALPKSRRMTVSWTCLALIVHDVIFFKGRSWAVTSRKEEAAKELVSRCEFIINHIPPDMISPDLLPKMKQGKMQVSPPAIDLEGIHSKITGFPMGGDQLRQFGFSGIFEDECAFQEDSEATFAAAEPTVGKTGRFIKVSSRSMKDGGFFKKICFDQLEAKDSRFPEVPPVAPKSPMEGVSVWKNPRNEFLVIDLHYTANPAKRGEEFREGLKRTLPVAKFRQEYEKSWETFDGRPVYEDFNERVHATNVRPKVQVGLPLLIGWDSSGLTPAAVIGQLQGERLVIVREIIESGMGARRFVPHVAAQIKLHFPQCSDIENDTISFFDPAGLKKNEITEETYLAELIKGGFKQIRPGAMTWKKRVESVVEWLIGLSRGEGRILIYENDCPTLVAGLKGGFRYPDGVADAEPEKLKPVKDIHSHPNDALQYMCSGLKSYRSENYTNIEIPAPNYGFQKDSSPYGEKPQLRKRYV